MAELESTMDEIPGIDELFPDEWRSFCNGPLAVQVERFGGINSIIQIDIREEQGKLFPDREPTPWMSRSGSGTLHRPLFAPGLRFMAENRQYCPRNAQLFPFGFLSDEMSMVVTRNGLTFKFNGHGGCRFRLVISKAHMREGKYNSLQNQLAAYHASNIRLLPYELRGKNFNPSVPFPDGKMLFERSQPVFDKNSNTLLFSATKSYADRKASATWAITADIELSFKTIPGGWVLAGDASKGIPVHIGCGFAETDDDAAKTAFQSANGFDNIAARETASCASSLDVELEKLPEARQFFAAFPGFQRKLIIAETEREMMVRAASFNYQFFALWDDVYPIRDFLLNGEPERSKKMLRYMLDYPWVETCPWVTMHLIITLGEYLSFVDDPDFERECLPFFRKYFEFSRRFADPSTGLLKTSLNCGVDNSEEVGMTSLFYPSCLNGWWYDSLRSLENFAIDCNDEALATDCAELAMKVDASYESAFFDQKEGYLRQARTDDFGLPAIDVFLYTHTIGMDYNYGRHLFRRLLPRLASWQATRLHHPMGHTAVPWDSAVPCEMWKAAHMSQHYGHEGKTARCGGRADEAVRIMNGFLSYFAHHKLAIETLNLTGEERDVTMTSRWQGFGATGIAQGILRGACGLDWTRGGFAWLPADENGKVRVTGLLFRGVVCDIEVTGKGGFIDRFTVNGEEISGTLQIPEDVFPKSGRADIVLHRSETAPNHPVLLQATDMPIRDVVTSNGRLEFTIGRTAHAPILVQAQLETHMMINDAEVSGEYLADQSLFWLDSSFHAGDRIIAILTTTSR
ncbi:MAG: hypothetical protein MJ025_02335 [Victivallaceae bacterium]|nr:hypothetical protein [Victivallaceae bacterium]